MSIELKHPPVNEVAISVYFNPILVGFRNEHVGRFWEKIKDAFPTVKQQIPAYLAPHFDPDEFAPVPRYWFISGDEVSLIQVQKNAFMFNWRRRQDNDYPRYTGIKPEFDKYYALFSEFIKADVGISDLAIGACELTYINSIESCEFWKDSRDTPKVIPSFAYVDIGIDLTEPPQINCTHLYKVADDLQLKVNINAVQQAQENSPRTLIFEIKASNHQEGIAGPLPEKWFQRAHDAILACFLKVTSKDIQERYWA